MNNLILIFFIFAVSTLVQAKNNTSSDIIEGDIRLNKGNFFRSTKNAKGEIKSSYCQFDKSKQVTKNFSTIGKNYKIEIIDSQNKVLGYLDFDFKDSHENKYPGVEVSLESNIKHAPSDSFLVELDLSMFKEFKKIKLYEKNKLIKVVDCREE